MNMDYIKRIMRVIYSHDTLHKHMEWVDDGDVSFLIWQREFNPRYSENKASSGSVGFCFSWDSLDILTPRTCRKVFHIADIYVAFNKDRLRYTSESDMVEDTQVNIDIFDYSKAPSAYEYKYDYLDNLIELFYYMFDKDISPYMLICIDTFWDHSRLNSDLREHLRTNIDAIDKLYREMGGTKI